MSDALAIWHGDFGRACLYRLDRPILTHAHREGHLIFFLDGAPATLVVDGEPCRTDRESAIAINPWEPHAHEPHRLGAAGLFLVLYVRPAWFLEASRQASGALAFGARRIELSGAVARAAERVASGLLEPLSSGWLAARLRDLVQGCFDQSWQWRPNPPPLPPKAVFLDFRVRKALKAIARRMSDDICFDDIAREAGLSRPHFYKMFKDQLGVTPRIYRNVLRVEHALDRLMFTRLSVTDIAEELGFACQSSFTRFFAANVGLSPSIYRERARVI